MSSIALFLEYLSSCDLRFYQERDLVLDLAYAGWPGLVCAALAVASATVFAVALFHVIPSRKRVVLLLAGLSFVSVVAGLLGTYLHYRGLPAAAARLIHESAGAQPHSVGQEAAVLALPLVLAALTAACNAAGSLFLALFWGKGPARGAKRKP
jgi:hypothetical protein